MNEFNQIIDDIIKEFPVIMQRIFTLLYREECTIRETAARLGLNEKTVSNKSKAIISTLKERLKAMQVTDESLGKSESLLTPFILFYLLW